MAMYLSFFSQMLFVTVHLPVPLSVSLSKLALTFYSGVVLGQAKSGSQQPASTSLQQSFDVGLEFWRKLVELGFQVVPKILWAIGILLLLRIAVNWVGRVTRKALNRTEPTLRKFLVQAAEILTLVVGIVAVLNTLGIQATSVVAVVGAAGLAVGLALQNTLSHFAAGVMLISLRPFEVGDFIEGGGVAGIVDAIGIFSTTLVTPDNVRVTVPNGNLFSGTLKNTTAMGKRRVDLEIDIGDRPIDPTILLLLSLVQPHPLVLNDPKPTCHVASISATTTVLYLRPWCAPEVYEQVRSEVLQLVKEALRTQESEASVQQPAETEEQSS